MQSGGYLRGPSHSRGGIPIEAEGGEYIVKKDSVTPQTKPILEAINRSGGPMKRKYRGGGYVSPRKYMGGGYVSPRKYEDGGSVSSTDAYFRMAEGEIEKRPENYRTSSIHPGLEKPESYRQGYFVDEMFSDPIFGEEAKRILGLLDSDVDQYYKEIRNLPVDLRERMGAQYNRDRYKQKNDLRKYKSSLGVPTSKEMNDQWHTVNEMNKEYLLRKEQELDPSTPYTHKEIAGHEEYNILQDELKKLNKMDHLYDRGDMVEAVGDTIPTVGKSSNGYQIKGDLLNYKEGE